MRGLFVLKIYLVALVILVYRDSLIGVFETIETSISGLYFVSDQDLATIVSTLQDL